MASIVRLRTPVAAGTRLASFVCTSAPRPFLPEPRNAMLLSCISLLSMTVGCGSVPSAPTWPVHEIATIATSDPSYARGGTSGGSSLTAISPTGAQLQVGESLSLQALDAAGNVINVKWASSNPAVVSVDAAGVARGLEAGEATVTAQTKSQKVSARFAVTAPTEALPAPAPAPPAPSTDFAAVVRGIRPRGFGATSYTLVPAAAGARTHYVSTNGNDANAGTSAAPFRTINRAAQVATAGDVVIIRAGSYQESVVVRNAGTADRPIVFQAEERGSVVLTGGQYNFQPAGWSSGVQQDGAVYVTLRGLVFRDYAPQSADTGYRVRAAVGAIRGWRIEDCLFDRAGYNGVDIRGNDVLIARTTFQYTHTNAVTAYAPRGSYLDGIRLVDVVLRGNHTRPDPLPASSAEKVSKFLFTRGTVLDNVESTENQGSGFWFDTENVDYTVRNSYFHRNTGAGLFIEINYAPALIENNVFVNNASAAVRLANSAGITVRGNLMAGNDQCVTLINADRGTNVDGTPRYPLRDISIDGNQCKDWKSASGVHALAGTFSSPAQMGIHADGNLYEAVTAAPLAYWPNTGGFALSIPDVQRKIGWEANGRTGTIVVP